jgi:hypothetical protein
MKRLRVAPAPCTTCPYRRDTPPGIWSAEEYEKLLIYDADPGRLRPEKVQEAFSIFHCHQEHVTKEPTVCRGWLSVHADHPAMRLLVALGGVLASEIPREAEPGLYATAREAWAAGLAGVPIPSPAAKKAIAKIVDQRSRVDATPGAYWLRTKPQAKGTESWRCRAVLPGEGRCFLRYHRDEHHRAGEESVWVEFDLAPDAAELELRAQEAQRRRGAREARKARRRG